MPYTRTQADALLTRAEMKLFDESRANAVRKLDAKALASRVERTRELRDKARDQLRRQRLASRGSTGSKRGAGGDANRRSRDKAELLAEILQRFQAQAKAAGGQARAGTGARATATDKAAATATKDASAKKTAAKKTATKKTATKKTATKKTATKKTATKKAATGQPATSKTTAGTAATGQVAADKASPAKRPRKRPVSPAQALANTRALLEAKKRHDREGPAWQHIDGAASPSAGRYQSPQARSRGEELHAGESRMTPIEGSISTRERKNQAKRDKR